MGEKNEAPKILGKMDVSSWSKKPFSERKKIDNREKVNETLNNFLENMANEVNEEYGHFLKNDGSVDVDSPEYIYIDKEEDKTLVKMKEDEFALKSGQGIEEWIKNRETSNGIITEKVITAMMHKFLKDDFIVARTTAYDDYKHGVDNVIIDKNTGAVICGFDEIQASEEKDTESKEWKIKEIIDKHQGSFVKYGATIKSGKLERCGLKNVPTFFLALSENDLVDIIPQLNNPAVSDKEREIFLRLFASIERQISTLYKDHIGIAHDLKLERKELLSEKEAIQDKYGAGTWHKTTDGYNIRRNLGVNKLRSNLSDFKLSLERMKIALDKK